MLNKFDEYYNTIEEIISFLKRDLVGPVQEDELLISESPDDVYTMGKLWPLRPLTNSAKTTEIEVEDVIDFLDDEELLEDNLQEASEKISEISRYKPSTMGISVVIPSSVTSLSFSFSFGKYARVEIKSTSNENSEKKNYERQYQRNPLSIKGDFFIPDKVSTVDFKNSEFDDIQISLTVRKIMSDRSKLVTVTISNTKRVGNKSAIMNQSILFQCKLVLFSSSSFLPVFQNEYQSFDSLEDELNKMIYRYDKNYAYGHGCATHYLEEKNGVFEVSSEYIPTELVYQMMPNKSSNPNTMQLQFLSEVKKETVCDALNDFIHEYSLWLDSQKTQSKKLYDCNNAIKYTLDNIKNCILRLTDGVKVLKNNENAWNAFQYMNESMLMQRVKTKGVQADSVYWFPFQLAYIIQIIPEIVNKESPYREVVDLLWFPTGGGKTEAYLGVASFTIFYKRLSEKPIRDGVTIFMRYTLRLLTVQQFERSAALICACEFIRQKYSLTGGEISIGLWIGSSMTPNHIIDAQDKLYQLKELKTVYEGNPVQVTKCPWCGSIIDVSNYTIEKNSMKINCPNDNCTFYSGLPIYVVDDDIYKKRPTLVLSTIDKFARITWEPLTANLFSEGDFAPDLIIQDELHLISGPLGSLAGVYEIALEELCGNKPKIIASTATVKQAKEQIKALYNRNFFQFPPNGISSNDSFFAIRAGKDERPARTYLGLCQTGGSITDLFIRVFANLMFLKELFKKQGKPTEILDHFYTTVGYFNAIKDLGSSSSILNDRIYTNVKALHSRKFKSEVDAIGLQLKDIKSFYNHDELTSRKSSQHIRETLEQLEISYPNDKCYSYVLASNMLSVGIDVNRLGVMTVYGQPKSNAEYIQATSRVGRQNPGLVLSLYSGSRSRDKSHYEQFSFYHKSFYKYVEATSVTPFSARSIEKALHCIFVAIVRHKIPDMLENNSASYFRESLAGVSKIKENILKRIKDIMPDSHDYASYWLDCISSEWEELAISNPDTLFYNSSTNTSLLFSYQDENSIPFPTTLNSLRNVEDTANIYLNGR